MPRLALLWLLGVVLGLVNVAVHAQTPRGGSAAYRFALENECPSPGRQGSGACRDFVRDHIRPLCANGRDAPENMQWQPRVPSKDADGRSLRDSGYFKDAEERRLCRAMDAGRISRDATDEQLCRALRREPTRYPLTIASLCER